MPAPCGVTLAEGLSRLGLPDELRKKILSGAPLDAARGDRPADGEAVGQAVADKPAAPAQRELRSEEPQSRALFIIRPTPGPPKEP